MQLTEKIKTYPKQKILGILLMILYAYIAYSVAYFFWMTRYVSPEDPEYFNPTRLEFNANLGKPIEQYTLGMLYFSGHNVKQDDQKALSFLKRAAGNGVADAQFQICAMLEESDPKTAFNMCTHAASQLHKGAAAKLGVWYIKGPPGQTPNGVKAATYLNIASERGVSSAMYNLAILYRNGAGVKPDNEMALYWIKLAIATEKNEDVKSNLVASYVEWEAELKKSNKDFTRIIEAIDKRVNERLQRGFE